MKPENRDLFPEFILFPTIEKIKRVAHSFGHVVRRLAGFMPEEPLASHSDHATTVIVPDEIISLEERQRFNWQQSPQRTMRFPHGSDGEYFPDDPDAA